MNSVNPKTNSASSLLTSADASAKLWDVLAVARLLSCSTRHVYRLSDSGRMPAPVKLGALVRWKAAAIQEWIDNGCKPVRQVRGGTR